MIRRWLNRRFGMPGFRGALAVQGAPVPTVDDLLAAAEGAAAAIEHDGLRETARTEIAIAYARVAPGRLAAFLGRQADGPLPSHKMAEAAAALARGGAWEDSAALAMPYAEVGVRDMVLAMAGEAAAMAGHLDAADQLGQRVDDPHLRDRVAYRQVQRDLADGRRDRATERLQDIDDPFFRGAAEAAIIGNLEAPARAAAAASLATRLPRLIDAIDGASRADHLRLELARALISGRQTEFAEMVIGSIGVAHFRAEGFLALAMAALDDGDVAATWQAIDRVGSLHLRATGLSALALRAADAGNAALALQMTDTIADDDVAADTLSGLAAALWTERRQELEARMDAIADPVLRSRTWIGAASGLADDDPPTATELLTMAESLATDEPPSPSQGRLLRDAVSVRLQAGDRQGALAAAVRLRDRPPYLIALARCHRVFGADPDVDVRFADAFRSLGAVTRGAQQVQVLLDAALELRPVMGDAALPL